MAQAPKRASQARTPSATAGVGTVPIGVNGIRMSMGAILEEEDPELRGTRAAKTYQRIALVPIIAAGLHAIDSVVRSVEWDIVPATPEDEDEASDEAKAEAAWVRDMLIGEPSAASWSDLISEVLSFIEHGYSLFEIVWERRDDGRIGVADIQPRPQDTILRWEHDKASRQIETVVQLDPETGRELKLPYEKLLHFVYRPRKRNPEGRSMLRAAVRPWKRKLRTEVLEDIGNERDLTGVPVLYAPSTLWQPGNEAALAAYTKLVRDVRFNEQAGIMLPSDPFITGKGDALGVAAYRFELLSTSNTRNPNIRAKHEYLDAEMARLLLAEFLLLGGGAGAYSLSKDKTDFLSHAIKALLQIIAYVVNTKLLPRLWALNGLDPETRPKAQPGDPTPDDLAGLAAYVSTLAAAGARMFPDDKLEEHLRRKGNLPPLPPNADEMIQDTSADGGDAFGGDPTADDQGGAAA